MRRQERKTRGHFWSRDMTSNGVGSHWHLTGLRRTVDLVFPSNRFAVIVSFATTLVLTVISRDGPISLLSGATTFFAWALGRELDPDRPRTANLAALTVGMVLSLLAFNRHLVFWDVLWGTIGTAMLMVVARLLTRSTGVTTTPFDVASLLTLSIGFVLVNQRIGLLLLTATIASIILDRVLAHHSYLANRTDFGLAFCGLTALFILWNSGPWQTLTGVTIILGTVNIFLTFRSPHTSRADTGIKLEPSRLVVAKMLIWATATGLASQGKTVGVVAVLAVGLWSLWPQQYSTQ
jgi:hypothetical protein